MRLNMRLILAILTAVPLLAQEVDSSLVRTIDRPVAHYDSQGLTIEDALRQLVGGPGRTFVIGFEQAADAGLNEPTIKLQIDHATVGEVLRAICSQNPRYTFSETETGVVDVYPIRESPEARAILDLPLRRVDISVRDWPRNIFAHITGFVPDLNAYLTARADEYQRRTHTLPPGSPGVTMTTDVVPPHVDIHLRQTTVRGALNAMGAYTLTHSFSQEVPNVTLGALCWKFSIQEDAAAPTGLGGYPLWSTF
jgi:hypothetical protein